MSTNVSKNKPNNTIPSNYPATLYTPTRQFCVEKLSATRILENLAKIVNPRAAFLFENYLYSWMDMICEDYKNGKLSSFWNFYTIKGSARELSAEEKKILEEDYYVDDSYSTKTFYGRVDNDPTVKVNVFISTNGFEAEMSIDAVCITATIFALSHLAELFYSKSQDNSSIVDACDYLKDFAESHPESGLIFSAID